MCPPNWKNSGRRCAAGRRLACLSTSYCQRRPGPVHGTADLAIAHSYCPDPAPRQPISLELEAPELTLELGVVARNNAASWDSSDDDIGIDPERYKGRVFVTTMHKAKGLSGTGST
jgi:hypothetical protein